MKGFIFLLTIFSIFAFSHVAEAHGGRTDSSGGHNCSEKSKAKGLCSGYHSHNGGGSSSGSSNSSSTPARTNNDKDCSDFSSYDEVVAYWNQKGYSATYDPERLDGWGNTVDDGIPCEAPSGYDTTKINNSPAQKQKQQEDQDKANGEKAGYPAGLEDGYAGSSKDVSTDGSDAYQKAYASSYATGYEEGATKLESEKKKAEEEGYKLGQKQDELSVPNTYSKHDSLKSSFEEGFNRAVSERDKEKEEEFHALGLQDGENDSPNEPTDIKESYLEAYKDGFKEGQEILERKYFDQGYKAAFSMLNYKEPKLEKEKYVSWYKEGFESNEEVEEIKTEAYNIGRSGEDLVIADEKVASEEIFNHHYTLGYDEYKAERLKDTTQTSAGFLAIVLGWLGRRFYVARKMIS